jgi:hypothetical protein
LELEHRSLASDSSPERCRSRTAAHLLLSAAVLLLGVVFPGAPVHAEIIDRVLAAVSGDVILLSDVNAARTFGLIPVPAGARDPMGAALDRLIDRELVLEEVDRYVPPEPSVEAVDAELQQVRRRFPTTDSFNEALERSGVGEAYLRRWVRDDLRIHAYLEQRFSVPPPSEDEVERYYSDHTADFTRQGQLLPFADVQTRVAEAINAERRAAMVDDWLAGLRRRADITNLYLTSR